MHEDQRATGDLLPEISETLRDCRKALQQLAAWLSQQQRPAAEQRPGGFLTIQQAAEYLSVNPKTLRRAIGDVACPLKHVRAGTLIRFKREWLDTWAERQAKL